MVYLPGDCVVVLCNAILKLSILKLSILKLSILKLSILKLSILKLSILKLSILQLSILRQMLFWRGRVAGVGARHSGVNHLGACAGSGALDSMAV